MPDLPTSKFWSQIDAALVINLKTRDDRWQRIKSILGEHLPEDRIVRVDAVLGRELPGFGEKPWFTARTPEHVARHKAGAAGCCLSHRKAIQTAKDHGYKRMLVLEDDADFINPLDTPEGDAVADVLEDMDAWDMFYLGFNQRVNKHHVVRSIENDGQRLDLLRIRGPLMTHAMIFNERIYDALLEGLPTQKNIWRWMTYWGSIDSWVHNRFGRQRGVKIWGTEPKLVLQIADYSDIAGRPLTVAESQGTHKASKMIPLDLESFENELPLKPLEVAQQLYKRNLRVLKARLLGHKKT